MAARRAGPAVGAVADTPLPSTTSPALITGTLFAGEGESESKGLSIRLVGGTVAARPFVGIRTPFNAAGAPPSLGASAASEGTGLLPSRITSGIRRSTLSQSGRELTKPLPLAAACRTGRSPIAPE